MIAHPRSHDLPTMARPRSHDLLSQLRCWPILSLLILAPTQISAFTGKVLLVSFDGFRWDYLDMIPGLTNFPKVAREGSSAPYMNNTFTTLTFSTHYSMATGLYQESHGMVSNYMYDPVFKESFWPGSPTSNDQKWWQGEPIWLTATLQEKKVGTLFWAGTEVEFDGVKPALWRKYDISMAFEERVDTVLDWFSNDDIDLGLVYFHQPDKAGHKYGPRSPEVRDQVRNMDNLLGYLMAGIESRELENLLNVIIVSDHGVTNISSDKLVVIPEHINMSLVDTFVEVGAICHVFPKPGQLEEVFRKLDGVHPNMTVYHRDDIPKHWHYTHNRRIGEILLVLDEGWTCTENREASWNKNKGTHGYDNRLLSMKPIFMAKGPDIRNEHEVKPFMSVDIYPLTAKLLGINPAPNNGTLDIIGGILKEEPVTLTVIDHSHAAAAQTSNMLSLTSLLSLVTFWKLLIGLV